MNKNKGIICIILLAILLIILLLIQSFDTEAKTVSKTRYITRTVTATKSNGRVKFTVNTRVTLQFKGKKTSVVEYRGERYVVPTNSLHAMRSPKKWKGRKLRRSGVLRWKGYKFTWYSQRILPGRGLKIPGRHVDKQGFVCDRDGYIVIASTRAMRKKRTVVPTPFGKFGKCYDCGAGSSRWRDCYTNF